MRYYPAGLGESRIESKLMRPTMLIFSLTALASTQTAYASVTKLVGTTIGVLRTLFTVHIDGQPVGSFESDLIKSGDVALYASTAASSTLRVAFDNLSVWTAIGTE